MSVCPVFMAVLEFTHPVPKHVGRYFVITVLLFPRIVLFMFLNIHVQISPGHMPKSGITEL